MNSLVRLFAWPALCVGLFGSAQAALPDGDLYWRNDERLAGRLLGADEAHLTWDHQFTVAPSSLERTSLRLAEFDEPPKGSMPSPAQWALIMLNGDCVLGDEPKLSATEISISTGRHALITVPLAQVQSLRRRIGAGQIFTALSGSTGWQGGVETADGGTIVSHTWGAELRALQEISLPKQFQIKLSVRTRGRPDFWLQVRTKGEGLMPRIETRDGELVLVSPDGGWPLTPLRTLPGAPKLNKGASADYVRYDQSPHHHEDEAEQTLRLILCVDRETHLARVFEGGGKELGSLQWTPAKEATGKAVVLPKGIQIAGMTGTAQNRKPAESEGLIYRNRNSFVCIEDLRVMPWNGEAPNVSTAVPRVELSDGTFTEKLADLALDQVLRITFAKPVPPADERCARLLFYDGTVLSGSILSATSDDFEIKVPWLQESLHCTNEGLWRLCCERPDKDAPKEPPFAEFDSLKVIDVNVHGRIVCDGASDPKWRMIGESQAQALRWPEHSVLKWSQSNKALQHDPPMGRVVLADGEVSAAKLVAIDSNGLSFSTPWSATTTMPHEQIRALRLLDGSPQRTGFADKGWAVSGKDGAVVLKNSGGADTHEVQMNVGGTLFHPSMMTGSDITFHIKTDYGGLQIDCCAAEAQDGKATKVLIWKSSNQIYVVDAANAANGVRSDQMLNNVDQRADVRVAVKTGGKEVVVRVNDVDLLRVPFVDVQHRSAGISFHTGSMWGNQQRPVTITHFRVENSMPVLAPLGVNPTARTEALTVPRFRRDRLPPQVLVATNGDVIRGEVEAATDHALRFAIGLESHDVPMERIDSIVWTQRPSETPPKAPEEKPAEKAAEKPRMRVVRQSTPVVTKVTIPRKPVPAPGAPAPGLMRWLTLRDGSRIALKEAMFGTENVGAVSAALGAMKLRTEELAGMQWAASGPAPDLREFTDWRLVRAPEPVLPESGGSSSPLLGKEAPTFVLPLLSGGKFDLKTTRGHVVVLDFWATWCGPCVSSLPQLLTDVKPFGDKVQLIGVNQGEAAKVIQKFIEQRKWEFKVALDGDQSIAAKYGVEGIPHTVIIDKTGKVSWVHVGYEANGSAKFIEALNAALK